LLPIRQDLSSLSERVTLVEKDFKEIAKGVPGVERGLADLSDKVTSLDKDMSDLKK